MHPKVKRRWIRALRSGKYTQAFGSLARSSKDAPSPTCFCALGVLADLEGDWWVWNEVLYSWEMDGFRSTLSKSLRERVGLTESAVGRVARKNDDFMSFTEIANWIETNL